MSGLDVGALRALVPALHGGTAYFDGPGGTQTPAPVADAIRDALLAPLSNRGRTTLAQRNADDLVLAFRSAVTDLLTADGFDVAHGRSATQLTLDVSRALTVGWGPGDEVVVSRLDHESNIQPWLLAAERTGASVRWVDFDPATGELPIETVAAALTPRTRLVALTAASNLIGTMPDLPAIAEAVHAAGALLYVDGVHLVPHHRVDLTALGADLFVCSSYKFLGPHHGVLAGRSEILAGLRPDKLTASSDAVPERFELGTLPYELLAGTVAAVDLLAGLAPGDGIDRRARLDASMAAVEQHESELLATLEDGIGQLPGVTVWSRAARRTPTLLLTFDGHAAAEVSEALAARNVNAPTGSFYAPYASEHLGLGRDGGLRIGLAPYNDEADVAAVLEGLAAALK